MSTLLASHEQIELLEPAPLDCLESDHSDSESPTPAVRQLLQQDLLSSPDSSQEDGEEFSSGGGVFHQQVAGNGTNTKRVIAAVDFNKFLKLNSPNLKFKEGHDSRDLVRSLWRRLLLLKWRRRQNFLLQTGAISSDSSYSSSAGAMLLNRQTTTLVLRGAILVELFWTEDGLLYYAPKDAKNQGLKKILVNFLAEVLAHSATLAQALTQRNGLEPTLITQELSAFRMWSFAAYVPLWLSRPDVFTTRDFLHYQTTLFKLWSRVPRARRLQVHEVLHQLLVGATLDLHPDFMDFVLGGNAFGLVCQQHPPLGDSLIVSSEGAHGFDMLQASSNDLTSTSEMTFDVDLLGEGEGAAQHMEIGGADGEEEDDAESLVSTVIGDSVPSNCGSVTTSDSSPSYNLTSSSGGVMLTDCASSNSSTMPMFTVLADDRAKSMPSVSSNGNGFSSSSLNSISELNSSDFSTDAHLLSDSDSGEVSSLFLSSSSYLSGPMDIDNMPSDSGNSIATDDFAYVFSQTSELDPIDCDLVSSAPVEEKPVVAKKQQSAYSLYVTDMFHRVREIHSEHNVRFNARIFMKLLGCRWKTMNAQEKEATLCGIVARGASAVKCSSVGSNKRLSPSKQVAVHSALVMPLDDDVLALISEVRACGSLVAECVVTFADSAFRLWALEMFVLIRRRFPELVSGRVFLHCLANLWKEWSQQATERRDAFMARVQQMQWQKLPRAFTDFLRRPIVLHGAQSSADSESKISLFQQQQQQQQSQAAATTQQQQVEQQQHHHVIISSSQENTTPQAIVHQLPPPQTLLYLTSDSTTSATSHVVTARTDTASSSSGGAQTNFPRRRPSRRRAVPMTEEEKAIAAAVCAAGVEQTINEVIAENERARQDAEDADAATDAAIALSSSCNVSVSLNQQQVPVANSYPLLSAGCLLADAGFDASLQAVFSAGSSSAANAAAAGSILLTPQKHMSESQFMEEAGALDLRNWCVSEVDPVVSQVTDHHHHHHHHHHSASSVVCISDPLMSQSAVSIHDTPDEWHQLQQQWSSAQLLIQQPTQQHQQVQQVLPVQQVEHVQQLQPLPKIHHIHHVNQVPLTQMTQMPHVAAVNSTSQLQHLADMRSAVLANMDPSQLPQPPSYASVTNAAEVAPTSIQGIQLSNTLGASFAPNTAYLATVFTDANGQTSLVAANGQHLLITTSQQFTTPEQHNQMPLFVQPMMQSIPAQLPAVAIVQPQPQIQRSPSLSMSNSHMADSNAAAAAAAAAESEMAAHPNGRNASRPPAKRRANKGKGRVSGYTVFFKSSYKRKGIQDDFRTMSRRIAAEWREMTPEQQAPFCEDAKRQREAVKDAEMLAESIAVSSSAALLGSSADSLSFHCQQSSLTDNNNSSCSTLLFASSSCLDEMSTANATATADNVSLINADNGPADDVSMGGVSWNSVLQLVQILDAVCADQFDTSATDCAYRMWSAVVYANLCRSSTRFPVSSYGFVSHQDALVAQWRALPLTERYAFEEKAEWFRLHRDLLPLNYQRFVYGDVAMLLTSEEVGEDNGAAAAANAENCAGTAASLEDATDSGNLNHQVLYNWVEEGAGGGAAAAAAVFQASEEAAMTLHQLRVCFSQ